MPLHRLTRSTTRPAGATPKRLGRLMLIIGLGLGMIIPGAATAQAAVTAVSLPVTDHGVIPLTATTVAGAAAGNMPDGSARAWVAVSGKPAYLAELDPMSGEVIATYPMADSQGAWGVEIAADGTVWVASYGSGNLYYLPFGADTVINAGRPASADQLPLAGRHRRRRDRLHRHLPGLRRRLDPAARPAGRVSTRRPGSTGTTASSAPRTPTSARPR